MTTQPVPVTLRCPCCGDVTRAEEVPSIPWWTYVHVCECGYTITESDWDVVRNSAPAPTGGAQGGAPFGREERPPR